MSIATRQTLAVTALLSLLSVASVARAGDRPPSAAPGAEPLPGFVAVPRPLPGIGRWQMAYKVPRALVRAIAWSPDGKSIVSDDGCYLRVWDAQTLDSQKILVGHSNHVTAIDWNRATNRIASSSWDGTVRIWSAAGAPEKVLKGHRGEVNGVAWMPDGKRLVSVGSDGTARIWSADGSPRSVVQVTDGSVLSVACSPDGKRFATGDNDYLVKIWNADGTASMVCKGHLGPVTILCWSSDGKHIASTTSGFRQPSSQSRYDLYSDARIWHADGSLSGVVGGTGSNTGMAWSADGERLALASIVRYAVPVRICNPGGGVDASVQFPFRVPHRRSIEPSVAWSPDGAELAAESVGQIVIGRLNDGSFRTSADLPQFYFNHDTRESGIPGPHGDKWLFRPSPEELFAVYDAEGKSLAEMPKDVKPSDLADRNQSSIYVQPIWNPAEDQIAFVTDKKQIRLWKLSSKSTQVVRELPGPIKHLEWSPRGDRLLTIDQTGTVWLLNLDGKAHFEYHPNAAAGGGDVGPVDKVRISPSGERVAIAGVKGITILRQDGSVEKTVQSDVPFNGGAYTWFWWSNDGNRLTRLIKWQRAKYRLVAWDLAAGSVHTTTEFSDEIDSADCSPDGSLLLLGMEDGAWEVRHLDQAESSPVTTTVPSGQRIQSIACSPDGQQLAAGGQDGLIRIWKPDAQEGSFRRSLFGNNDFTNEVKWTVDSKRLISISNERSMRVWNVDAGRQEMSMHPIVPNHYALLTTGGRWIGLTNSQIEDEFLYLIEQPGGAMEVVSYSAFLKRTGQPAQ